MIKILRRQLVVYLPKSEYYELPNKYDRTVVRLLVQSPTRIFVYWEVSEDSIKSFESSNKDYAHSTPTLKVKNVTMNYSYNIPIDPFTNNYYIDVKDPDCEYQVELGRISNGNFTNIYTSNSAKVPRSTPVRVADSEEIIYRNHIKLDLADKFTVYYKRCNYNIDGSKPQDYSVLPFAKEFENPSSTSEDINSSGSFERYENGISSMENVSSFSKYEN